MRKKGTWRVHGDPLSEMKAKTSKIKGKPMMAAECGGGRSSAGPETEEKGKKKRRDGDADLTEVKTEALTFLSH